MKKIDKLGRIFNTILSVLYIPLSLFCWLMQMVSVDTIDATNPLYITWINIFCVISFFIPLLCIAGIVASNLLRRKGYSVPSFVVQFIPLAVFILNFVFGCFSDFIPKII